MPAMAKDIVCDVILSAFLGGKGGAKEVQCGIQAVMFQVNVDNLRVNSGR